MFRPEGENEQIPIDQEMTEVPNTLQELADWEQDQFGADPKEIIVDDKRNLPPYVLEAMERRDQSASGTYEVP